VHLAQALAQQVGEEAVVAVPFPAIIERNDKEIGRFKVLQDSLRLEIRDWRLKRLPNL